jgi:serine/threonine-protein kinase
MSDESLGADRSPDPLERLPLSLERQVDAVCRDFVSALRAGKGPRMEDFVSKLAAPARPRLIFELILEEVEYRQSLGQAVNHDDYYARFPDHRSVVDLANSRVTSAPESTAAISQPEEGSREEGHAEDDRPEPPQRVGRYTVLGVLGRGGFGMVYRARDTELQRDVAIKVWRPDRFATEEEAENLLGEARAVARLKKHPSIVAVYDVGRQADGSPFVVLEYIEGHTLKRDLGSHKLPARRIWEIMIQVTSAVQHAHASTSDQ